ncbi:MAG: polysaccharide deacetylase family protein [Longimicrobiales bacterium]
MNIPILMYHEVGERVDPRFRKYTVTPARFAAQVGWLAGKGYSTILPDQLLAGRRGQAELPARPVMITFDDGFADSVRHAVPVLSSLGFTAVFYVVTGLVGKTSRWIQSELGLELPLFDWSAAKELEAGGFRCESHTVSHPRLARLEPAACRRELVDSRMALEDRLGREVRHLAYPFGSYDDRVAAIAHEAGYVSACTSDIGLSAATDRPLALRRVLVSGEDTPLDFRFLVRSGMTAWQRVKSSFRA